MFRRSFSENPLVTYYQRDDQVNGFKGSTDLRIINYPVPRLIVDNSLARINKQDSFSLEGVTPKIIAGEIKVIRLDESFDIADKTTIISFNNYIDISNFARYITYKWSLGKFSKKESRTSAKGSFLCKFEHIIKVDLSLFTSDFKDFSSEEPLASFLHFYNKDMSLPLTYYIDILKNQHARTLLIIKKPEEIIDHLHSEKVRLIIDSLKKFNNLLILVQSSSLDAVSEVFNVNPRIIKDVGLSWEDVSLYVERNFPEQDGLYQKLQDLFKQSAGEICKSSSMLQMLCYILTQANYKALKTTKYSNSIASIYYDIITIFGEKYANEHLPNMRIIDVFKLPIMKLTREIGFNSLSKKENIFAIEELNVFLEDNAQNLPQDIDHLDLLQNFNILRIGNRNYRFTDIAFRNFFAALYLKSQLASHDETEASKAMSFISQGFDDPDYLPCLKFLSSLITFHNTNQNDRALAMGRFWGAIANNNKAVLRVHGDNYIKIVMNILSQHIVDDNLDKLVPQKIIDEVDEILLKDLTKWRKMIAQSQYFSVNVIAKLLDNTKIANKAIQAIKILGEVKIIGAELKGLVIQTLKEKLISKNFAIFESSIKSLGKFGEYEVIEPFLRSEIIDKIIIASEVVGEVGDVKAVTQLMANIYHRDLSVVLSSMKALSQLRYNKESKNEIADLLLKKIGSMERNNEILSKEVRNILLNFNFDVSKYSRDLMDNIQKQNNLMESLVAINGVIKLYKINNLDSLMKLIISLKIFDNTLINRSMYNNLIWDDARKKAINVLESLFFESSINKQIIIDFLKDHNHISSKEVKLAVAKALGSMIAYDSSIVDILVQKIVKYKFVELLEKIENYSIKEKHIKSLVDAYSELDSTSFKVRFISFLTKTFPIVNSLARDLLLERFFNNINSKEVSLKLIDSIEYDFNHMNLRLKLKAKDFILNKLRSATDKEIISTSIAVLDKLDNLSISEKQEVQNIFISKLSSSSDELVREAILKMLVKLPWSYQNKPEMQVAIIANIKEHSYINNLAIETFLNLSDSDQVLHVAESFYNNMGLFGFLDTYSQVRMQAYAHLLASSKYDISGHIDASLKNFFLIELSKHNFNPEASKQIVTSLIKILNKIPEELIDEVFGHAVRINADDLMLAMHESNKIPQSHKSDAAIYLSVRLQEQTYSFEEYGRIDELANIEGLPTLKEQRLIEGLYQIIVCHAFETSNVVIRKKLLKLIELAIKRDSDFLSLLDMKLLTMEDMDEKSALLESLSSMLSGNPLDGQITQRYLWLQAIANEKKFSSIEDILNNLQEFSSYIRDNNLDIKITKDTLFFQGYQYELDSNFQNIEKIYIAINPEYNDIGVQHLFSKSSSNKINSKKMQLSVLRKVSKSGVYIDSMIIVEMKNIFGYTNIFKISVVDNLVQIDRFNNLEPDYRVKIFGEATEYIEYYIQSFNVASTCKSNIPESKIVEFVEQINSVTNKDDLIYVTISAFPDIGYDPTWRNAVILSINELIEYRAIEARMDVLEHKIDDLENVVNRIIKEVDQLHLEQETIKKLVEALQEKVHIDPPMGDFTVEQKSRYFNLVHFLMESWMAAMVVQTEMVQNSKQGVIGSIGSVFSRFSSHVPMVGLGVELFSQGLIGLDGHIQETFAKNIAQMAAEPGDMAFLAKKIAHVVAISDINYSKFESSQYIELIKDILSAIVDLQGAALDKVCGFLCDQSFRQEEDGDKIKGKEDAHLIGKLIISYVSVKNIDIEITVHKKHEILQKYLIDNKFIDLVVKEQKPILLESISPRFGKRVLTIDTSVKASFKISSPPKTPDRRGIVKTLFEQVAKNLKIDNFEILNSLINAVIYDQNPTNLAELLNKNNEIPIAECMTQEIIAAGGVSKIQEMGDDLKSLIVKIRDRLSENSYLDKDGKLIKIIHSNARYHNGLVITGAVIMKIAEVIPAIKYLSLEYIPVAQYFDNTIIIDFASKNEYAISLSFYLLGSGICVFAVPKLLPQVVQAAFSFVIRPVIYKFGQEAFNSCDDENGWIKFFKYMAIDTAVAFAYSVPFAPVNPLLKWVALGGAFNGAINYYNQLPKIEGESNIISKGSSFIATTATFVLFGYQAYNEKSAISKFLVMHFSLSTAAYVNYATKISVDWAVDYINNVCQHYFVGESREINEEVDFL